MATLEIDADELAIRLSQAITFAIQECAKKNMKVIGVVEEEPKKKRGRPRKEKPEPSQGDPKTWRKTKKEREAEEQAISFNQEEVDRASRMLGFTQEPIKEILEYQPPSRNDYVAPAKRANFTPRQNESTTGMSAHGQSVVDPNRKMKFYDDPVVGDRFKYADPIPTTRAPAVKQKFTCDRCHRQFEAYWSEVPQALHKERIAGIGEGQPMVTCDNCLGK